MDVRNPVGSYFVVPTATAMNRGWKLCENRMREYQKLRRQAFKLAFWPTGSGDEGVGADIDWDWIQSLGGLQIGELRIDEVINEHDNIRVIFFKAKQLLESESMPRIWLLTVFQKKRQNFTSKEIRAFKAARNLIVQREYGGAVNS